MTFLGSLGRSRASSSICFRHLGNWELGVVCCVRGGGETRVGGFVCVGGLGCGWECVCAWLYGCGGWAGEGV